MNFKATWEVTRDAGIEWWEDKAPRLGAALAYYTALSLAPLLVVAIGIAGFVFGEEAAQGQLVAQMEDLVGHDGAAMIQTLIINARAQPNTGIFATVVGLATLLFAAAGVFGQLQEALNTIFEVEPKPGRGFVGILRDRFLSFTMVVGVGFLLLVSLMLSAALAALSGWISGMLPGHGVLLHVGNFLLSLFVITVMFAMIFKLLPDVKLAWNDVWLGAAITALLFVVGKTLLGLYLGHSSIGSAYGAAGSFVVLLVWLYYSSQILFMGAEWIQVYANRFGSRVVPADNAKAVTEEARANEGMTRVGASDASAKR